MPEEKFRYDTGEGTLWLDGTWVAEVFYSTTEKCWLVDSPGGEFTSHATAAAALTHAQTLLRGARDASSDVAEQAKTELQAALLAAGIQTDAA